jgi:hypothetical protein
MPKRKPLTSADTSASIARLQSADAARFIRGTVPPSDTTDPSTPELRARYAIESLRGQPYQDAEWREARENLNRLMRIAVRWQDEPVIELPGGSR